MARTLTLIQVGVRYLAKDEAIDLTDADNLKAFNRVYRNLAFAFPWGEFNQIDTSLTTVADQEQYAWPATPVFADVLTVEVEDDDPLAEDAGLGLFDAVTYGTPAEHFRMVQVPKSERDWSNALHRGSQLTPSYWRMINLAGAMKLEMRPAPLNTGKTIKITGVIEPTEFTLTTDATIFLRSNADDALEHLIAADQLLRDGMAADGAAALNGAKSILRRLFSGEQITTESVKELISA